MMLDVRLVQSAEEKTTGTQSVRLPNFSSTVKEPNLFKLNSVNFDQTNLFLVLEITWTFGLWIKENLCLQSLILRSMSNSQVFSGCKRDGKGLTISAASAWKQNGVAECNLYLYRRLLQYSTKAFTVSKRYRQSVEILYSKNALLITSRVANVVFSSRYNRSSFFLFYNNTP